MRTRLLVVVCVLFGVLLVCGCEQTKGNTPDTKKDTIVPTSSMESAYKTGDPGKAAAPK